MPFNARSMGEGTDIRRSASTVSRVFLRRTPAFLVALTASSIVCAAYGAGHRTITHRPAPTHIATARMEAIRFWSFGDVTRVVIQAEGTYKLRSDQIEHPSRLYFDFSGVRPPTAKNHGAQTILVNDHRVKQIRIAEVSPGVTRVVFDLDMPAKVLSSQLVNPDRLIVEVRPKSLPPPNATIAQSVAGSPRLSGEASSTESVHYIANTSLTSAPKMAPAIVASSPVSSDDIDVGLDPEHAPSEALPVPVRRSARNSGSLPSSRSVIRSTRRDDDVIVAKSDSAGDRSLVRVFGLKLGKVVIDAGHGGHDTGTIGPHGLMEKDLALDVALRLGQLISQKMGAEVVYTRSDDTFIPLEQRTKIANNERADLFISIHANSSPEPSATGVETYYFNFTGDRNSLDLATRENATSGSSIADLSDLLHKAVLTAKTDESREFAQKVQTSLWGMSTKMNARSRDRGVKQAPFVVLIGAAMPSILAEIGFVSNAHDENLLRKSDQREKIAEALYKGISQYANTLSHMQIARVNP